MNYRQKHAETCLAKCLMILVEKYRGIKIPDSKELDMLFYSLKYERENIARGHLEKITKDYELEVKWYVDSKIFTDFVKKTALSRKIHLINKKIDLKLIDKLLPDQPLILYLDRFYLWEKGSELYYKYHYPHFVIVTKKLEDKYEIIDPDDGKVKKVPAKILSKTIIGLRNHLWISPQIIQLNK